MGSALCARFIPFPQGRSRHFGRRDAVRPSVAVGRRVMAKRGGGFQSLRVRCGGLPFEQLAGARSTSFCRAAQGYVGGSVASNGGRGKGTGTRPHGVQWCAPTPRPIGQLQRNVFQWARGGVTVVASAVCMIVAKSLDGNTKEAEDHHHSSFEDGRILQKVIRSHWWMHD